MIDTGNVKIPCLCVTNRHICAGDFLEKIKIIASGDVADAIILREKDLKEEEYYELAEKVKRICDDNGELCILHTFYRVALELGNHAIHVPLAVLETMSPNEIDKFEKVGSSIHSLDQAKLAAIKGATYVTAGHVFETDCKKGVPGRGLDFIKNISSHISIPVYGIGGITSQNACEVFESGAAGVCVMSGFMLESGTHLC